MTCKNHKDKSASSHYMNWYTVSGLCSNCHKKYAQIVKDKNPDNPDIFRKRGKHYPQDDVKLDLVIKEYKNEPARL